MLYRIVVAVSTIALMLFLASCDNVIGERLATNKNVAPTNLTKQSQSPSAAIAGQNSTHNDDFVIEPDESLSYIDFDNPGGYTNDFVPDAKTAYDLAVVYLYKQFGSEGVDAQKPYHISEDKELGLWMIRGTVFIDKDAAGGGAIDIVIRKKDGKVMLIAAEA